MSDLIPWQHAMVLWDAERGTSVRNVRIVRHPARERYPQTFSDGACWADWGCSNRRPADVFGALLAQGFANHSELRRALREFSQVSGCGWAKHILEGGSSWGWLP